MINLSYIGKNICVGWETIFRFLWRYDAIFSDEIISTEYGLEHRLFVCEVCNKKHSGVFFYSIACI